MSTIALNMPLVTTNNSSMCITSTHNGITVRSAQPKDFDKLVEWSTNEDDDWELAPADFEVWQRCFPPESFLAAVDSSDDLMGFCAGVKHGDNIGFIGMYYVKEEFRGCGVGAILWKTVMKYLEGRNLCLAAVPDMVAKYRDRNAFRVVSNWRIRMACGCPKPQNLSLISALVQHRSDVKVVEPSSALITKVVDFDAKVAGMNRESWCRNWVLNYKGGKSLIAVSEEGQDNQKVVGYGQVHEISPNRLRVGPLYADDEYVARLLISNLLSQYPDIEQRDVRMSLVAGDERTERIVMELGLDISQDYFELRMHTQYEVPFDKDRMFIFSDGDVNFV